MSDNVSTMREAAMANNKRKRSCSNRGVGNFVDSVVATAQSLARVSLINEVEDGAPPTPEEGEERGEMNQAPERAQQARKKKSGKEIIV